MKRVVIMGAGGRDFHDFNVVYRNDPDTRVVAFIAAQIPGIGGRVYPPSLAGPLYPGGIPIVDEPQLADLIEREHVDQVVFAYSDLAHTEVMHKASLAMAHGADFAMIGPGRSMLSSVKPVVAVCAARTGCGKSQTSRLIGGILTDAGLDVSLIRHPMPYGNLERMRVQRFTTLADIDASDPTIEEREEYEEPVRAGLLHVGRCRLCRDPAPGRGGVRRHRLGWWQQRFPFYRPDLFVTVVDPLRPGHELEYHPGEINVRMADVVVVNKVDVADPDDVALVIDNVRAVNRHATIVQTASPVRLMPGPELAGKHVLVIEDGPTLTHGGMPFGAGTVAVRRKPASARSSIRRAICRRLDRRYLRQVPGAWRGAACHGIWPGPARGAGGHHPERPLRRRCHRHTDRPRSPHRRRAPGAPGGLRVGAGGGTDARRSPAWRHRGSASAPAADRADGRGAGLWSLRSPRIGRSQRRLGSRSSRHRPRRLFACRPTPRPWTPRRTRPLLAGVAAMSAGS